MQVGSPLRVSPRSREAACPCVTSSQAASATIAVGGEPKHARINVQIFRAAAATAKAQR